MDLRDILPVEQIHEDEPMYKHTTFRVGGKAALFLDIKTSEELQHILELFSSNCKLLMLAEILCTNFSFPLSKSIFIRTGVLR